MKKILLILLFYSNFSFGDNFKIGYSNESFSLNSKDLQSKGDLEISSTYNPTISIQYNKNINKKSKLILNYQGKYLNFGNSFSKERDFFNDFQIGQGFFIEKNYVYYLFGASERFFISSINSELLLNKSTLPSLQIGINSKIGNLDGFVFGIGGSLTHYNSLNMSINDFKIKNGTKLSTNFNFTKFYKKIYYKLFTSFEYEAQPTSITTNVLYKNNFGFEIIFIF